MDQEKTSTTTGSMPTTRELSAQDQPKSKLVWYLFAILIIVLAGALYWYFQGQVAGVSKNDNKQTATPTAENKDIFGSIVTKGLVLLPAPQVSKSKQSSSESSNQPSSSNSSGDSQGKSPDTSCTPLTDMYVLQEANKILINLDPVTRFNGSTSRGKLTNTIDLQFAVPAGQDENQTKPDRLYLTMHSFPDDKYAHTRVDEIDEVTANTAALMTEVPIETKETNALKITTSRKAISYQNQDLNLYCVSVTFKNPDLKKLTNGQIADGSKVVLAAHFAKNKQLYPVLFGYYQPKSVEGQAIFVGENTNVGHAFKPFSYYLWLNAQITLHLKEDPS